jgi:hypothetical protein
VQEGYVAPETKRNITLKLGNSVLRTARVMAAEQDVSVSELVATLIEQAADSRHNSEQARQGALARLRKGYHLGFRPAKSRDELHER